MWLMPLLLIIPNVALSVMSNMPLWPSLANILLPLGAYLLLMAAWRLTGRTALCFLPIMVLAAFQIVLLFLYGDGSIIGVDMFLNVATTNSSEALELLGNLLPAILTVVLLYLPAIVFGIVLWCKKMVPSARALALARYVGAGVGTTGVIALLVCICAYRYYRVDEDLFPVNTLCNLGAAFAREHASANYPSTSADYSFYAMPQHPDSLREVYIAVVGETSRADNWQLFGYDRFTTPRLCSIPDSALAACSKALSESNTTHKSVPLLLSTLSASDFADSINSTKSVITAFNEAGFQTAFLSLQARNNSYIDFFGLEADTTMFLREPMPGRLVSSLIDKDILPVVDSLLALKARKQLIVVHLYGSHFNYSDRYSRQDAFFLPDIAVEARPENRGRLLNAYDNSIRQTDEVLAALIARLDSVDALGGMIFTSDHGEDIYDDVRQRFLHASPTPTFSQLHVPFLVYFNPQLRALDPDKWHAARVNSSLRVSSSESFTPTLLDMASLKTPRLDPRRALTSHYFHQNAEPLFLNDRNRAEPLSAAGFHHLDFERLKDMKLSGR